MNFHYEILSKRIRELSFLNNGVKIRLIDLRTNKEENFAFSGGIAGFVQYINRSKTVLHPKVFHAIGEKDNVTVEVAMQWNDSVQRKRSVLYQQHSPAGWRYASDRLRAAMTTRIMNKYIEENDFAKKPKSKPRVTICEGLTCVFGQST